MSDNTAAPPPVDPVPPPVIRIMGQYIKDLSFEVPQAPEIFNSLRQQQPEIPSSIEADARHMGGTTYEVTVSIHLEAFVAGKTAFIMELDYGCVVEIDEKQIPTEHMHPVLLIEVPRQLFPFIRQIVADMTIGGGFPPLMMSLIDFAEIYKRRFGVPAVRQDGPPSPPPTIN
jgi:preprotein translocase subunit SecB